MFALPNLRLPDPATPVEERGNFASFDLGYGDLTLGSPYVAIVSPDDPRVQAARPRAPGLEQLLDGVVDEHGTPMRPAILVTRDDVPAAVDLEALRAFRNAIAMATVLKARVGHVRAPGYLFMPFWADTFDLYPAQVGRDGKLHLASAAVQVIGGHRGRFVATTAPYLHVAAQPILVDHFLYHALAAAWRRRYQRARAARDWDGRALFRSLEVAYAAASVPLRNGGSLHDHGIQLGLWVSAMEILVRTEEEEASEQAVRALVDQAPWYERMRWVRARRYAVRRGRKKQRVERYTPAGRLLFDLYQARNDFLHGNEVGARTLRRVGGRRRPPHENGSGAALVSAAPVLYRIALRSFLAQRYRFDAATPTRHGTDDELWELHDDMRCEEALRILLRGPDAPDPDEA